MSKKSYVVESEGQIFCVGLDELIGFDAVKNYRRIATIPGEAPPKQEFTDIQELVEYEKELFKTEDPCFMEMLDLIGKTAHISYTTPNGRKVDSLYVGVDRVYGNSLGPVEEYLATSKKSGRSAELYREKETVLYGIASLLHREGVEKAFMSATEGGINFSAADSETKSQAVKLNEMRFLDYRDGNFVLRSFTPEEFCSWFLQVGSYYSRKYKIEGRRSILLDKSMQILSEMITQKSVY